MGLVCEAQRSGETAAWVTNRRSTFFPPDAAKSGVDLARLPVVFAPDVPAAARASWRLVQSDGFGLVVLDLVGSNAEVPIPLQSRLAGTAQAHRAAVVFVTEKAADRASLGSLVSLRSEAHRAAAGADRFLCTARALKDKRRGPGWTYTEVRCGRDRSADRRTEHRGPGGPGRDGAGRRGDEGVHGAPGVSPD